MPGPSRRNQRQAMPKMPRTNIHKATARKRGFQLLRLTLSWWLAAEKNLAVLETLLQETPGAVLAVVGDVPACRIPFHSPSLPVLLLCRREEPGRAENGAPGDAWGGAGTSGRWAGAGVAGGALPRPARHLHGAAPFLFLEHMPVQMYSLFSYLR